MKKITIALCALAALALAGCGATTQQIVAQNDKQVEFAKFALQEETKREIERYKQHAEVLKAIENRKAEEAKAAVVEAGAMMRIAEKADAGGRAAIAVNMSHNAVRRKASAAADDKPAMLPASAPIKLPELQPLKTSGEVLADIGKAALNSPLLPTVGTIALEVVRAGTARQQSRDNAASTQALYAAFTNINGKTVDGMRDLGTAGINGAVTLGSIPRIGNVIGDGNAFFGSVATRTVTVDCPVALNTSGGNAGNGGNGAGGAAANASGGAGGGGAPSGSVAPVANVNCVAGK